MSMPENMGSPEVDQSQIFIKDLDGKLSQTEDLRNPEQEIEETPIEFMSFHEFARRREKEIADSDPVFGFTQFKCKYIDQTKKKVVCKSRCRSRQPSLMKPISRSEVTSSRNSFIQRISMDRINQATSKLVDKETKEPSIVKKFRQFQINWSQKQRKKAPEAEEQDAKSNYSIPVVYTYADKLREQKEIEQVKEN